MIIDFHTHIFPKQIRHHREDHFPAEPAFELLYRSPKSRIIGMTQLVAAMDEQGVDKSVVFGFPWRDPGRFLMHNDYVMDAMAKYPDRLIGFGCFDLFHPDAASEADRCLSGGLAGIGELAFYQGGLDADAIRRLVPIMEMCRDARRPVMIHTNEPIGHQYPGKTPNTLSQLYDLISAFPQNRLVLAHWGGGLLFYALLKKQVKEVLSNVYFDTAASPFLYDRPVYAIAVQIIGAARILFGSDYPLIPPTRYFKQMAAAGLDAKAIDAICGKNAGDLLNIA
jgi:predicted TIM-barrel fold metal-dependent hydrolase